MLRLIPIGLRFPTAPKRSETKELCVFLTFLFLPSRLKLQSLWESVQGVWKEIPNDCSGPDLVSQCPLEGRG